LFDLRYHVASLAAVFLALIIGILVGVGIASQTSVSESDRKLLENRIAALQSQFDDAAAEADLLRRQQTASATYIERSYSAVMEGRLRGVRVAFLFVGQADPDLREAVTRTLEDAGGPPIIRRRALLLPVDPEAVTVPLETDDGATIQLDEIGRRLGKELVSGGETPTWDALSQVIVEDRLGGFDEEVDAVVVAHTARISHAPTARFVSGIYAGIAESNVPAVGIERTTERPSRISVYRGAGLSSVDSVDRALGRVALAELLHGGAEGHYGLKSTAEDGSVPQIEPLALAPLPGG
jgi:predicted Zn-dependent protease with MMP-like domain